MNYQEKFQLWLHSEIIDLHTKEELNSIEDEMELEDRFYKELEFGTGGLRGKMGAGTNRMNVYTIGKATQGLANYLIEKYKENISVSIAYDSRNNSETYALAAAQTLCANGIRVNLFSSLRPTPMLSYTVRKLRSKAGIVITASHNPKQYNGYKVYGEDGGQITDEIAKEITGFINELSSFEDIKNIDLELAKEKGLLIMLGEEIDQAYIEEIKQLCIRKELVAQKAQELKVIYTPLHGSGNVPVRRVLKELGFTKVFVVPEQELPNGDFPTATYPNPEEPNVFNLALTAAEKIEPDIIFGTDPDCDRIGVVVRDEEGSNRVLSGNQVGVLLTHYILSSLQEEQQLPKDGVIIKTIVTTDMAKEIAKTYGVELIEVLTGFKYIGEKIEAFHQQNGYKFIFGFEESFGYLMGDFVRDKDAVIAAMLIAEMALYYKQQGMSLYDALLVLYKKYGFYHEELISIRLEGKQGQQRIEEVLDELRHSMKSSIGHRKIIKKMDYKLSIEKDLKNITESRLDLPKSNVLKFVLDNESWFVVRPSGTEPKMKIYFLTKGNTMEEAKQEMEKLKLEVMGIIEEIGKEEEE